MGASRREARAEDRPDRPSSLVPESVRRVFHLVALCVLTLCNR